MSSVARDRATRARETPVGQRLDLERSGRIDEPPADGDQDLADTTVGKRCNAGEQIEITPDEEHGGPDDEHGGPDRFRAAHTGRCAWSRNYGLGQHVAGAGPGTGPDECAA